MNATEVHLILNHVPVVFSITGGLILLISLALGSIPVRNTGLIMLVAAAITTIPVFLTGEGAEETVEKLGIAEALVERHEELAEASLYIMITVGVLAALSIVMAMRNKAVSRYFSMVTMVGAFFAFGFIAQTAHLGGQIRHTEIGGAAISDASPGQERGGDESGDND